jgi:hypothetical protein
MAEITALPFGFDDLVICATDMKAMSRRAWTETQTVACRAAHGVVSALTAYALRRSGIQMGEQDVDHEAGI